MGYAIEDVFVALNAADWQAREYETPVKKTLSRRLQLRAQIKELVDVYSLRHQLGPIQDGLLMDALCLTVKQLLGLSDCWLLNGTLIMGASASRKGLPASVSVSPGELSSRHPVWKRLNPGAAGAGYAATCPLFRQTGGLLLMRFERPVPLEVMDGFGQVVGASIRLQHYLWQIADNLDRASESELQQCRTELTEWILNLLECQQDLMTRLSQFISQRNGLESTHPLRVATLASQMADALNWPTETGEALWLAGFQTVLEGVQWKNALQDGQRRWTDQDKVQATAQSAMGWALLGQFFPLLDWPAIDWQPHDEPASLLRLVRNYCALTETRRYRAHHASARRHQSAIEKLGNQQQWPSEWLEALNTTGRLLTAG